MLLEQAESQQCKERREKREEENCPIHSEGTERQRQQHDQGFSRTERSRKQKVSSDDPFLGFENVNIEEGQESYEWTEVDPQGLQPPPSQRRLRRDALDRLRQRGDREPLLVSCATHQTLDWGCCHKSKTWISILVVLMLFAGLGVGIYAAALADPDEVSGDDVITQCKAVINGFSIPNESLYPVIHLSWVMDISTTEQWENMPQLPDEVKNQFQDIIIPTLAGCLYYGGPGSDDFDLERFYIVNGNVRSVQDVGSCRYGEVEPCVRVLVDFVVSVRGELAALDLIAHIAAQYTSAVIFAMEQLDLVKKTGLVGLFEK